MLPAVESLDYTLLTTTETEPPEASCGAAKAKAKAEGPSKEERVGPWHVHTFDDYKRVKSRQESSQAGCTLFDFVDVLRFAFLVQ